MKGIILVLFGIIFSSLFFYDFQPNEDALLYGLIRKAGKELEQKYQMKISGIGGGGAGEHGIWLMEIMFDRIGAPPLSIEEGRKMIVDCANIFLEIINKDEPIRPYLKDYPFTIKNIDIAIFNYDKENKPIIHPFLQSFSTFNGKIMYLTEEENQRYGYKSEKIETYEEALVILGTKL